MDIETPEAVENRVFHEEQMRPGSICRRYNRDDAEEWKPKPWFVVISEPRTSKNTGTEFVRVVWLSGDEAGQRDRFFLGDLGVKPPYRGVTEKHEFEIPEKYIASSYLGRVLVGLAQRIGY